MNRFNRRTAIRIAAVSLMLASLASPLSWFVARNNAVESIVSLASEESGRLLRHHDAINLAGPQAGEHAVNAAKSITGGLFDIAEIYDSQGRKLADSATDEGELVESLLPQHDAPNYSAASYESLRLPGERWVLRVFIPLRKSAADPGGPVTGYFEGVRVVPPWQQRQIVSAALTSALLVGLASLLCGAVIYPVVVRLSSENERKAREVLDSHVSMMEALGRAIAKRDSDTGAHNYRVAWIAARIAERMGIQGREMQALIAGSFLHDVGKIGIPDYILLKPGRLTPQEFEVMKGHARLGFELLEGSDSIVLQAAAQIAISHHEKFDGSGYPNALAGEAIPLDGRIVAVADVFDALTSERPYKKAWEVERALGFLRDNAGSHFDPDCVGAFVSRFAEAQAIRARFQDEEMPAL